MNEPKTRAELRRMEREWKQREAVIVRNATPLQPKPPTGYESHKKRRQEEANDTAILGALSSAKERVARSKQHSGIVK